MNQRNVVSLCAVTALGFALLPGSAVAQQKSLKDQLVGTWLFVSAVDVMPDGRKNDRWGSDGKGIFMFDSHGRFTQFITRSDILKFKTPTMDKATPDEFAAVMKNLVASFGTYTVNEGDKMVITRVEGGVFPNLIGIDQKRVILSLTADELKYTNPSTSTGTRAEATWRRAK